MIKIDDLIARLGDIPMITSEKAVKAKSRDFFWYSPILKEKLDHITGDLVVVPRNETDVVTVLSTCYDLDIPVTPRGGGTGNYGQAMPLAGGVVMDMTRMNAIKELRDGVAVVEPGVLMGEIDKAAHEALGQELRIHPSTLETASIGGFVAGGSGGVGSIRWGMLAETGNILRLRLATMEAKPQLIDLTGPAINHVHHAYGVTGIITEIDMPLTAAPDWVDMLVSFPSWKDTLDAGWRIAGTEGLWLKLLSAVEAPAPENYFKRHAKFLQQDEHVLCIMVAPNSTNALEGLAQELGGRIAMHSGKLGPEDLKGLPHLYHLGWNHTTLRGLRIEPAITYLQIGFPDGHELEVCEEISTRYKGEIIGHVEFTRGNGAKRASGLPLVRYRSAERLMALIKELEAMGCPVWNPHVYTLEEGNRRDADPDQLAMKKENDPKGLLNPGKMIAWDHSDYKYDPDHIYSYPDLQSKGRT